MEFLIYSDGSCSGNGKNSAKGGWAAVILKGYDCIKENWEKAIPEIVVGFDWDKATNQRMELLGAIGALERISKNHKLSGFDTVRIVTDSAYLCNCFNQKWYKNWQRNGWKTSKKEPVINKDLWERLIPFFEYANFSIEKTKGHNGDFWNEMVDTLAVEAGAKGSDNAYLK